MLEGPSWPQIALGPLPRGQRRRFGQGAVVSGPDEKKGCVKCYFVIALFRHAPPFLAVYNTLNNFQPGARDLDLARKSGASPAQVRRKSGASGASSLAQV